ncbi:MAG: lipoprotein-releasing ABC transporter permease subunit [Deltaproteobacteria bacterium]|nr:lipoprotein-releasing ABC transporter permease subunit [Deltaproteobacteria bacterium]
MGFFETFVAWRLLRGVRRQKGFISLSTVISTAGVAVGVMALLVVIGVMTGFDQDLKRKILSVNAHVILTKPGANLADDDSLARELLKIPQVVSASPFIFTQVMFSAPGNISGGVLRGVDLATIKQGGPRGLTVQQGDFADLADASPDDPPRVAIGNEMAKNLNLRVGDYLNIISPLGSLTPMGRMPRMKPFRVTAVFHTGMYEFDSNLVFASIPRVQEFLGLGNRVTGLELQVQDLYAADRVAAALEAKLGPTFLVKDWMRMNRSLFAALKLEKVAMFIILTLIILVAAFGIASTLFMMVMKKTREIAILKSMGATRNSIMQIFIVNGLTIGVIGTSLGLVLGLTLAALLRRYEFIKLPRDVYYISTLPVQIQLMDVFMIIGAALVISFVATLYPSWQAARLDPVEAIRYE